LLLRTDRLRQQFAIALADQPDPLPDVGGPAEGGGATGTGTGPAAGAADTAGEAGDVGAGAATAIDPWNADDPCRIGPHRATCEKDLVIHSRNLELLPGRHQYAPVAKKKT
jgi:hypothetical protein